MGKIRVTTLGDEDLEKKQKKAAKDRREEKKAKKAKEADVVNEVTAEVEATGESQTGEEAPKKASPKKVKQKVRGKKYQEALAKVDRNKLYKIKEALTLAKETSITSFDATVEVHMGINPQSFPKDKKNISGVCVLPHGTGKKRIVAVADEKLIEAVTKGTINFDVLVAEPAMMPKLAKVARILGPKGLMPSPKNGTVTTDVAKKVKELEGGEISWKSEPEAPVLHQAIGKVSFDTEKLLENLKVLVLSIGKNKILKITLSSTMSPGIKVDIASL